VSEAHSRPGEKRQRRATRRELLLVAGPALAIALVNSRVAKTQDAPSDPTKLPGRPIGEDGGYGARSPFETERRWTFPMPQTLSSWSNSPLASQLGVITPSGLHFERHHAGIPTIAPTKHELFVHGMVMRPKKYTMADLKRFPSITRTYFIECAGNGFTEWEQPTLRTVQQTHGLFSTSEWTGVQFSTIAREVGIKTNSTWTLAEGADAAMMTRSIPVEKLLKDGLIAYSQNGEAIRPEQGYPLRLIVPGWEGSTHIKWLRRLEVSDKPFMTREDTSKYTNLFSDGMARQFEFVMEAKSVITFPSGEMRLPEKGFFEVTGLAWSGRGCVTRVDVSTDGGKSWGMAWLQEPIQSMCATRFRFPWHWDGRPAILQSRCTDETGYMQPTLKQLVGLRGQKAISGSVYHYNSIQSWAVARDGTVSNVHA
jgi:sulfane dehydrogenase subunit SoxC